MTVYTVNTEHDDAIDVHEGVPFLSLCIRCLYNLCLYGAGIHDGDLGQAYARELALRGFSVALIGKDQQHLELVADMIEQSSKVKTLVVVTSGGSGCVDRCAISHNFGKY